MDVPTLTRRAMAEAAKADRRPAATAPTPTIRPVATPLDNQTAEHVRHVLRKTVRKAAGAEQIDEVLDLDFSLLKAADIPALKLFET